MPNPNNPYACFNKFQNKMDASNSKNSSGYIVARYVPSSNSKDNSFSTKVSFD
jgi:hypothetical protein